ncbi:MAG TPA: class I SAM-dependent methyltransferase, partial [Dehalococcoidia bacterium]|nr:class I SAM-dependent methyltransferase [Dehalococcoidia bacterium]
VARFLVERNLAVTGIDISPKQIELAKNNVPEARFEVEDMQSLREGDYAVDGVVAMYSIFHIDRHEHERLLRTLHSFLTPSGALLVTMGASDWEGSDPDFQGAEMHWSHFGPERNREMTEAAGFTIVLDEIDESGGERHQVILAIA